MRHRDRVDQGEAVIGVAVRTEASEMGGHKVLTKGVLRTPISAPVVIVEFADGDALIRAADDIDRNLPLHQLEIPVHRETRRSQTALPIFLYRLIDYVTNRWASE